MSDAVLDTPLGARSLIEASAGTGKTYALAGLFARAVIVERRRAPQVLAVTYTVAATQELHARVRLRLQRAAELAAHWRDGDPARVQGDSAETALLRHLLHTALHDDDVPGSSGESLPALRLRLARAVRDMDLAAIATIHGFCQRVLSEHALDTGEPLVAAELQPDNAASRRQLAVELWREFSDGADAADFLRRTFTDIDGLALDLRDLLTPEPLLPPPPSALPPDPRPALDEAWRALRTAFAAYGEQAHADLAVAIANKTLKNSEYKVDHIDSLWSWLHKASRAATVPLAWHGKCAKYTPAALRKGTSKDGAGRTPQSPLFAAMATMLAAGEMIAPWREAGDLQRLHALRARARDRDRTRKHAFNVRGYDDLVGAVFDAVCDPHTGPRLAQALREQFPLVLVDEFQDTDARQWAIFERLFGVGGLVLVGDPKQAIYRFRGGDVQTYLQARGNVEVAAKLECNFRSRPCVLEAVNALFAKVPDDALGGGIAYAATTPGDKVHDDDYQRDAQPAPALTFHVVPDNNGKAWNKDESIAIAALLCAQAIRDRLRDGRITRRGRHGLRALEPRDCAVLVRTHVEAIAVRAQLARLGVPAVAAGRQSLFATDAAQELLTMLLALAAPGDERRLRAALATRLLGFDAMRLRALEDDGDALRDWQRRFDDWRLRWQQHGPQAMLADVVAQQAARLLALADGERQLTHLLHLGELMQEARAQRLGAQGQLDWLRAAIDTADKDDEAQLPRLESDASRVQILTLHTSKGLEFPLVFLPFVGIGRGNGNRSQFVSYHDAFGPSTGSGQAPRVRQWKTTLDHGSVLSWSDACARSEQEEREEDMRLLYVGLTRARDALWLCGGALASTEKAALHRLLGGNAPDQDLRDALGARLQCEQGLPEVADTARLPSPREPAVPPARVPQRRLHRDWWIHSFSQLHRQRPHGTQALIEDSPASDERPVAAIAAVPRDLRFSGERFGNVLHHALEHADFAAWRDHAGDAPPSGQDEVLRRALQSQDYRDSDFADGVRELTPLVAATLNAPLPGRDWNERMRLCDLPPTQRIAELEFHFTLDDASAATLLALLHTHGVAQGRRDFGAWPRLAGLMTGKIDLTCRVDGRIYVLDYKSNYLPEYDAASLQQAMVAHEYDLQALLYAVAVHRWLRLRLGAAYDFDLHFGGVRYLFCRGLRRTEPTRGVVVPQLSRELIEAVDDLLSPRGDRT